MQPKHTHTFAIHVPIRLYLRTSLSLSLFTCFLPFRNIKKTAKNFFGTRHQIKVITSPAVAEGQDFLTFLLYP